MLRIKPDRSLQKGFNIMELMVTVAVGSVLLSVGVPAFKNFMDNSRMSAASNELVTSLHLARTEAIKRRTNVMLCPSSNWNAANPNCNVAADISDGWVVLTTTGNIVLLAHGPLNDQIDVKGADTANIIAGPKFVQFGANGFPAPTIFGFQGTFNFQLCDSRGDADTGGGIAAGRWIQITTTGRPQIHRTQVAVESAANPNEGCS